MFVGEERLRVVDSLVRTFDQVAAEGRPAIAVLEAETGLGKTRIIQEFYARLAARQPSPPYWPSRIDSDTGDVLRDRKRISRAQFEVVGGAQLQFLWWAVTCTVADDGTPESSFPRLGGQLQAHTVHLQSVSKGDAKVVLDSLLEIVDLASPVQIAYSGVAAAKATSSIVQRLFGRRKAREQLEANRTIDASAATESTQRAMEIAKIVRELGRGRHALPIVLVVDDAHLADPGLLDLLNQLSQIEESKIMILLAGWPSRLDRSDGVSDRVTARGIIDSAHVRIGERFSRHIVDKLEHAAVTRLLLERGPRTQPNVLEKLVQAIDGNPLLLNLYLSLDIIKHDLRDGAFDVPPEKLTSLPATTAGVWLEAWRSLGASTRIALTLGALQGEQFDTALVAAAAGGIGEFEAARAGLMDADQHGWIESSAEGTFTFSERVRFELARQAVVEQLSDDLLRTVNRILVEYVEAAKASESWDGTGALRRTGMLQAHLAALDSLEVDSTISGADSAYQLALDRSARDDIDGARAYVRQALALLPPDDRSETAMTYLALAGSLDSAAGDDTSAFKALEDAAAIAKEAPPDGGETLSILEAAISELPPEAPQAAEDDGNQRPWTGWASRPLGDTTTMSPADWSSLAAEIVDAESPLTFGRLSRLIARSSEAGYRSKAILDSLEAAMRAGARSKRFVMLSPYRGCDRSERIVSRVGGPDVLVRTRGDRALDEVPFTELSMVARRVLADHPDLDREQQMRAVMKAYDTTKLLSNVKKIMERTLKIAQRELTSEKAQADRWSEVHRAITLIPEGRWTAISDVASLAETSPGWVGRHLYSNRDISGLHRVLETDGKPWRWFAWIGEDRGSVVDVLRVEGSIDADSEVARPDRRLSVEDLRSLLA